MDRRTIEITNQRVERLEERLSLWVERAKTAEDDVKRLRAALRTIVERIFKIPEDAIDDDLEDCIIKINDTAKEALGDD